MKVITTNLLNRFWKNGVKPIKEAVTGKLDASKVVNSLLATEEGFALDATQGKALKDQVDELNRNLVQTETGKFILPNGLKIFWGKGKTPNTTDPAAVYSAYVIFPETFSNGDYFFTCTEFIGTGEAQKWDKVFNYYSHSNSGTYVGCTYPGKTFYWLAVGY